ncbi:MAG: hypothetical protein BWY17_02645 [Deltaproteobacteria bacterium ADurb.Bin207]|jgi:hypothetical protein|nr:MAG: hypothetical protein BWY17_02645 [Deltaproteobacteria bacterium ADurb.Bin207]
MSGRAKKEYLFNSYGEYADRLTAALPASQANQAIQPIADRCLIFAELNKGYELRIFGAGKNEGMAQGNNRHRRGGFQTRPHARMAQRLTVTGLRGPQP